MKRIALLLPILSLSFLGCVRLEPKGSPPRYFLLAPLAGTETAAGSGGVVLQKVVLPDYLQKAALALRRGEHEILYASDYQWAEPLDRGIRRVLTENWRRLAAAEGPLVPIDLVIHRFEADLAGQVTLELGWTFAGGGGARAESFSASGPSPAEDPAGTVRTMSEVLRSVAERIHHSGRD